MVETEAVAVVLSANCLVEHRANLGWPKHLAHENVLRDLCGDLLDLLERYDLIDWFGLVERLVSLVLLDLDLRELRDLRGL